MLYTSRVANDGGSACGVPQFQLPQRTPGQTRQARGGRQRPPGGAWAGPGAHCGVGPAWVLGGFFLPSASPISARDRLAAHIRSNHRPRTSLLLRTARAPATPASSAEGPRFPRRQGRRATGRPSPPRSKRGAAWPDQPLWCLFPSRVRQAPALDRHVQTRRRHGRPLRLQRRRRDGENVTSCLPSRPSELGWLTKCNALPLTSTGLFTPGVAVSASGWLFMLAHHYRSVPLTVAPWSCC